ncbi:PrpF domain-containing protein [Bradyrhizobium sp. BR 10289]|uniref:2-methylaconitate cis-trans isomerase PrpF family protein n=1 Tax=Bradyrhizobium sp. BR 10289 TaxID=2749993 RepID=UPI001C64C2F1|nr:PrpF domain-containing protein [Bradyrhizobium sp. BR 10289]MBW7970249.1 PrpF protein [Bradyrhizobium sp. BR 10289]
MESHGEQSAINCVIMRAGTSKGLFFHERALPPAGSERDRLLLRLMGSPDVLQIDGLGGSRPITSKVAVIARSSRTDADVDYTFAQVEVDRRRVVHSGNCGNISAGVGPFAVDEGLVPAVEGVTRVRIHNTNTGKIIVADVPVLNGRARVSGDLAIPGVPGTGAPILLNWVDTVGAKTGRLLPTQAATDVLTLEDGSKIPATLCDVGNPVLWVAASDVGMNGSELDDAIHANTALLRRLAELRGKAAALLGFCEDWRQADEHSPGLPMIGVVAPPASYLTLSGVEIDAADVDLRVRLMFMGRLHESIAGTGSMCLAAASRLDGSVVRSVVSDVSRPTLRIGHPSGAMTVKVATEAPGDSTAVRFTMLGMARTARRLARCEAFYPHEVLNTSVTHGCPKDAASGAAPS